MVIEKLLNPDSMVRGTGLVWIFDTSSSFFFFLLKAPLQAGLLLGIPDSTLDLQRWIMFQLSSVPPSKGLEVSKEDHTGLHVNSTAP